jgi:hypothetical protein|nr:MAG TPA: protein of unknown function DUF2466 [Caudoviricetes sp.]
MRIEHFRYCFSRLNGFYLKEHLIMFRKPLELWNEQTGESNTFKTIEDALKYKIDGETIEDIILSTDTLYIPPINGGRGSSGESKTFKFSHAKGDGRGDKSRGLLPAYANTRIKTKNIETAMRDFRKNHVDSDHEWAYEVDGQGYVHQYVEGNKSSVRIGSRGRNTIILHNHPNGGAFSDADLISTAMDRQSSAIVASGKKYDYIFKKGTHFKSNSFVKAVKTATMSGKDYDTAVNNWLKKNQKKYGYKYSRVKR